MYLITTSYAKNSVEEINWRQIRHVKYIVVNTEATLKIIYNGVILTRKLKKYTATPCILIIDDLLKRV